MVVDDEGRPVPLRGPVRRVVSIVPSLTEAVAATARDLLVGATDWCTHPADLDVVAGPWHEEPGRREDRRAPARPRARQRRGEPPPDLDALRAAGLAVYVTDIRTLDGAFVSLRRMLAVCGFPRVGWLGRRGGGVGRGAAARGPAPGRGADLAAAVDGRRPRHVHRCRARPPGRRQRARRATPSATRASTPPRSRRTTWSCCPTSRTCSPRTTGPRRSRHRPSSSRDGC